MKESPILLGFNLINNSIIISSDRPCQPFNDFIQNILFLIGRIQDNTTFKGIEYTSNSISEIQKEIVFSNSSHAQIIYKFLLKHLEFDKLSPGIVFKKDLPSNLKENLTTLTQSIQQLIANSNEIAFKMDNYCRESTPEMVYIQEEVQVLVDLIKSQSLIVFKKLEIFCE